MTQLVVYVLQSLQWAVESDPEMVRASVGSINLMSFVDTLLTMQFNRVSCPLKSLSVLSAEGLSDRDNLTFVKQRRLIAKLLVLLFRDFDKFAFSDHSRQFAVA